jgi:ubiquinone biosynthesis protein
VRVRRGSSRRPIGEVRSVLVATDRSASADLAVEWAAEMAARYEAELLVLRVVGPDGPGVAGAEADLRELATRVAGERGRARVVADADPSGAIVRAAEQERVDVVVVGNVGMSGRREFLLGNVPNRVSHNARCTVVIVNTMAAVEGGRRR